MSSRVHARVGTIRQLEILLAVHDLGSIKLASEQLHLTQPTVSMQLTKLSESIGMPLYERSGKTRRFTDAGHAMVATAREVLGSFARLDMQLSDMRGLRAGTLNIAVVTTSKYFIPHLLGSFLDRYPGIDVHFKVGNRQQIIDRLHQDRDDIYVFSHPPEEGNLDVTEFLPNPLVAIAASGHPLAKKKRLDIADLADKYPAQISRGQRQRTAIARTMTLDPDVLLMDEPAGGINPSMLNKLIEYIRSANTEREVTIFLIEHNMDFVMEVADRIYVLAHGEKIAEGPPETIQNDDRVLDAYLGRE